MRGCLIPRLGRRIADSILGLVLGPLLEKEFRCALIGSRGDWWVLVDRPLSATILAISAIVLVAPLIGYAWRRLRAQPA